MNLKKIDAVSQYLQIILTKTLRIYFKFDTIK